MCKSTTKSSQSIVDEERTNGRRDNRAKQTAEIFTPSKLVAEMLDKLPNEVWKKGKTFCDPACGNGNILIHVLWRKIEKGHEPLSALKTIYGVDIMRDNIRECRLRLLKIISIHEKVTKEHIEAVFPNIVFLNRKKYPQGSLQYDFSFKNFADEETIKRWLKWIRKDHILDNVTLPVPEEIFGKAKFEIYKD